jgi:hypothetical protein
VAPRKKQFAIPYNVRFEYLFIHKNTVFRASRSTFDRACFFQQPRFFCKALILRTKKYSCRAYFPRKIDNFPKANQQFPSGNRPFMRRIFGRCLTADINSPSNKFLPKQL